MKNDKVNSGNTTRRLPIVVCQDISPSMSMNRRMQDSNMSIRLLIDKLAADPKAKYAADVAFVTFSSNVYEEDFKSLDEVKGKEFTPVKQGGTNISAAVTTAVRMLQEYVEEQRYSMNPPYMPFLILITDGDPDETNSSRDLDQAVALVQKHCANPSENNVLIAPYIIGVGEQPRMQYLNRFAEKFSGNAFIIDGDAERQKRMFEELFVFISESVSNSLRGADNIGGMYETFTRTAKKAKKETAKYHRPLL